MDINIHCTAPRKESYRDSSRERLCEHCTDPCELYVAVKVGKEVLAVIYDGSVFAIVQFEHWIWYVDIFLELGNLG